MLRTTGALAALAVLSCAGCASVDQRSTQALRVDAVTDRGEEVADAKCTLINDKAVTAVKSGSTTQVRRSDIDLEVVCRKDGLPDATGRLVSRVDATLVRNNVFAAAFVIPMGHSSGAAYTYPRWVRLVFGQFGVFDRSREAEGEPLSASLPIVTATPRNSSPAPK